VSLPPPGQAPIVEKYTADEADDYYSADARNYALIAKELIRTGGTALPFDPVFLSKTAMNAIYSSAQELIMYHMPHIYSMMPSPATIEQFFTCHVWTRTNGSVEWSIFIATGNSTDALFRKATTATDLDNNGNEFARHVVAYPQNRAMGLAPVQRYAEPMKKTYDEYLARKNSPNAPVDPVPGMTLHNRLKLLDKIRLFLLGIEKDIVTENKIAADAAVKILERITAGAGFADLVAGMNNETQIAVAINVMFMIDSELLNYIGLSTSSPQRILIHNLKQPVTFGNSTIINPYDMLSANGKKFYDNWEIHMTNFFYQQPSVAPPAPEPDVTPVPPASPAAPVVSVNALLEAQMARERETQEALVSQNNKALDTLAEQNKLALDAIERTNQAGLATATAIANNAIEDVLASNERNQRMLAEKAAEEARVAAEQETARERIRAAERIEAAKLAGATQTEIVRINAESSNEIALANARAVNAAAARAGEAAVGSVKAVLGEDGLPGVLGTIHNMLNDTAAQNARMNYEREQTRQIEAALAAQKEQRALAQITELQFAARQEALERERKASQQIQDLIAKVSAMQQEDPAMKTAKYSEIMSKLAANVVIQDKQSCRIEVSAKQELNFGGENITLDGLTMKQKVSVSSNCYQDAKKLANLQEKMKAQIAQFAKSLSPDVMNTAPEQYGTNATLDITTNFTSETMQEMISIANGDQSVNITAKNTIIRNIVLDQTIDMFTQLVQKTTSEFDIVKEFANTIDKQIEVSAEETKKKAADDFAKAKAERDARLAEITKVHEAENESWVKKNIVAIAIVAALIVIGGGVAGYLYSKKKSSREQK
jgi:hypothetical protein